MFPERSSTIFTAESQMSSKSHCPVTLTSTDGRWQLQGLSARSLPGRFQKWLRRTLGPQPLPASIRPTQLEFNWDPGQAIPVNGWRPGPAKTRRRD